QILLRLREHLVARVLEQRTIEPAEAKLTREIGDRREASQSRGHQAVEQARPALVRGPRAAETLLEQRHSSRRQILDAPARLPQAEQREVQPARCSRSRYPVLRQRGVEQREEGRWE